MNFSELRRHVDSVLEWDLGTLYTGVRDFRETIFGQVAGLKTASQAVFKRCKEDSNPLFGSNEWSEWPADPEEGDVRAWFVSVIPKLEAFAEDYKPSDLDIRRELLDQPTTPLLCSTGQRKMDIGFVNHHFMDNPESKKGFTYRWSHILIPGELQECPSADEGSEAWLDLATYVREVLSAQDGRRFVLGFTLCGSLMRIWEFDRLGGFASEPFDINEDGLQFVSTILGFLWMGETELGFDPTIIMEGGKRYIDIEREGNRERLVIDHLMMRAPRISGRATTCWKAHRKDDPGRPLVIKDSWECMEREQEGVMLQKAKNVKNVVRYYHHKTVRVGDKDDDVRNNVRRGLDITTAENYQPGPSKISPIFLQPALHRRAAAAVVLVKSGHPAKLMPLCRRASDPVRQKPPAMSCQIECIGVSFCLIMGSRSTRQALMRLCFPRWWAALKDTSPCITKASFTETSRSTI